MAIIFRGSRVAGTGKPGESAYEAAKRSGYEGSEEEFAAQMNDAANFDEFLTNHNLDDEAHSDIREEIDSLKTSVSEGKSLIAAAVTDKGVPTAADATFDTIKNNIENITTIQSGTSDATAKAADILEGVTAYADGEKITGSIPVLDAMTITPGSEVQTIRAGSYLGGDLTVEAGGETDWNMYDMEEKRQVLDLSKYSNIVSLPANTMTSIPTTTEHFVIVNGSSTTDVLVRLYKSIGNNYVEFYMRAGESIKFNLGGAYKAVYVANITCSGYYC